MLRGHPELVADAKTVEVRQQTLLLVSIDFVDSQEKRLAGAHEESREFHIRCGKFASRIDHEDHRSSLFQRHLSLAEYLSRNKVLLFRKNAPGIHDPQLTTAPFGFSV